ncbi:MAG: hypothetical protein GYB31_10300 [Bacteroidetes bacterium]|nr:hypothetical protein [Bacteroidota bacterium]
MRREEVSGSKMGLHQELVSIYRQLEKRINSHSNLFRNSENGQSMNAIEKMNTLKKQRILVKTAADTLEKSVSEDAWKRHVDEYRQLIRKSNDLLSTCL